MYTHHQKSLLQQIPSFIFGFGLCVCLISCGPQPGQPHESTEPFTGEVAYDSTLAAELGADDYGMKMYVFAFLRSGPNRDLDSTEQQQLQRAHMDNISRMADEGKLVLAGPFGGDGDIRGLYIFDVPTVEEAEALTNSDPAIQAGSLVMELIPWYGAATLPLVNEWYKKVTKQKI